MKIGLSEIVLILLVIGVILIVFRGMPNMRREPPPPRAPYTPRVRRPTAEEIEEERIKGGRRNRMRWLGSALLVVGIAMGLYILKALDVLLMMYAGAGLVILLGIIVLVLSTRR